MKMIATINWVRLTFAIFFGFTLGIRLSFMSLVLGSFLAFPYALYFVIKNKEKEIIKKVKKDKKKQEAKKQW